MGGLTVSRHPRSHPHSANALGAIISLASCAWQSQHDCTFVFGRLWVYASNWSARFVLLSSPRPNPPPTLPAILARMPADLLILLTSAARMKPGAFPCFFKDPKQRKPFILSVNPAVRTFRRSCG